MKRLSKAALDRLVDEAIVDAYGDSERFMGFFVMIEDNLAFPFPAQVLGVEASVIGVEDVRPDDLVFLCARDRERLRVRVLYLPRPMRIPEGWEWLEAFRFWATGR